MKNKITLIALAMVMSIMMLNGQSSLKVIANGNVGISTDDPIEKLQVNGGINLGNTRINAPGTIRWTGEDFEGFDGLDWKSLTQCSCDDTEEESSSTTQDDQEEEEETQQEEQEEEEQEEEETTSDDQTSDAGCESAQDIATSRMSLNEDWSNQINTNGLGFSDEGELCYTITAYEGNTTQMMGLSEDPEIDKKYEYINYAFYHRIVSTLNSHRVYVWENNERKGIFINSKESYAGSTFCIRRNDDSEVQYFIDDELVYTSTIKSSRDLYFDNSFYGYSEGSSTIWSHQPSNVEVDDITVCSDSAAGLLSAEVEQASLTGVSLGILDQNYPNPFTDETRIDYDVTGEIYSSAELVVTNSLGQVINRKSLRDQQGEMKIQGSGLSSGIYQYTIFLDGVAMEGRQMVVD